MRGHDQGLQQPRHREHAEDALEDDDRHERERKAQRHEALRARRERDGGDHDDQQPERARRIAMDHFAPCLAGVELDALRTRARWRHMTVTAGPVGATKTCIRQAYIGAEHHDTETQAEREEGETAGKCSSRGSTHGGINRCARD
jgi:hypothetical protein